MVLRGCLGMGIKVRSRFNLEEGSAVKYSSAGDGAETGVPFLGVTVYRYLARSQTCVSHFSFVICKCTGRRHAHIHIWPSCEHVVVLAATPHPRPGQGPRRVKTELRSVPCPGRQDTGLILMRTESVVLND